MNPCRTRNSKDPDRCGKVKCTFLASGLLVVSSNSSTEYRILDNKEGCFLLITTYVLIKYRVYTLKKVTALTVIYNPT